MHVPNLIRRIYEQVFCNPIRYSEPSGSCAKIRPISIVTYPGVEIIDLTGPMEVFAFANNALERSGVCSEPAYPMQVLAANPGPVMSSCGLQIIADKAYSHVQDGIDTLLIRRHP